MTGVTSWRNRIVGHGDEAPGQLLANPRNWRLHPKHQQDALSGVLNEVGWVQEITVNRRTGFVVDGHLRVALAVSRRERFVPVRYVDLDEDEEALVLATLDPIGALAGSNADQLSALLEGLQPADEAVANLLRELAPPRTKVLNPDDADLTPPDEPITQPGDLWVLGDHRLLCGDSSRGDDMARLMNGDLAAMVLGDPPYNVNYRGGTHGRNGQILRERKDAYADERADYEPWLTVVLANAALHSVDVAALHLWFAMSQVSSILSALSANRYEVRSTIIWDKGSIMGGIGQAMKQYRSQYEPMVYCFKRGRTPSWYGPGNESELWAVPGPRSSPDHPTMKPVSLYERSLANHTKVGDLVLECFGGSGTTAIAAEQTDRAARLMEIEPAYCDVIVRRWERVSGRQAVKENA